MSAIGKISNRNIRLLSIFKVLGIYLVTLLLLIWVFRGNIQQQPAQNENGSLQEHYTQLKQDTEAFSQMLHFLDTIATSVEKLVVMDEEELANPGSKEGDIDIMENDVKTFLGQLRTVESREVLGENKAKFEEIYKVLVEHRRKIKREKMGRLTDKEQVSRQVNEAKEAEQAKCESRIAGMETIGQLANNDLTDSEQEVVSLTTQVTDQDNVIKALEKKQQDILVKLGEVKTIMEQESMDENFIKNRKKLVEMVYQKILNLESFTGS